ncbi:MAG: hypothetical protein ACRDSR_24345 [Pseudonocardiaceae bacterium]
MNMVIVLEILLGIVVLAAAVRFAVRDARQRRGVAGPTNTEEAGTGESQPARGDEQKVQPRSAEVADQREGEEVVAVSASSTATSTTPEPSADAR